MINLYKTFCFSLIICSTMSNAFAQLSQSELQDIFKSILPKCQNQDITKWSNCLGELSFKDGETYTGEFKNGKFHGKGVSIFKNNAGYEGQWKDGMFDGFGTYKFENGGKYVGEFKKDLRNGKGYVEQINGSKFEGQWKNDVLVGVVTATYADGSVYVGTLKDGLPDGKGTKTLKSGANYTGQWKSGAMDGKGTFTYENGTRQTGIWAESKLIKDESPKPPSPKPISLSCVHEGGRMAGLEVQYFIDEQDNSVIASRGGKPSNVVVAPTLIIFNQDTASVSINRVNGKFSLVIGSIVSSGTCQLLDQAKPKF